MLASPLTIFGVAVALTGTISFVYYLDRKRVELEFYESGMIRKITLPADPMIVATVVGGVVIVACICGVVYYLSHRDRH